MVKLGLVKRECVATSYHITVRCTQAAFQQAYNNLNLGINAVLNFIDSDNTNEVKVEFIQIDNTVGDVDD